PLHAPGRGRARADRRARSIRRRGVGATGGGRGMTPTKERSAPVEVLLVEDDPGDVLMTREAFAEHTVHNKLTVVSDGEEALAYLRRQGAYRSCARPDLILLDLNLPRRDGREVLAEIKTDEALRPIP